MSIFLLDRKLHGNMGNICLVYQCIPSNQYSIDIYWMNDMKIKWYNVYQNICELYSDDYN